MLYTIVGWKTYMLFRMSWVKHVVYSDGRRNVEKHREAQRSTEKHVVVGMIT